MLTVAARLRTRPPVAFQIDMATECRATFAALADPTREQIVRLLEGAGLVKFRAVATPKVDSVDPGARCSVCATS